MNKVNLKNFIKKNQRRANTIIKNWNTSLAEDELFLGRFYLNQIKREVYRFEDGSGAEIYFTFEIVDKKTGIRKVQSLSNYELHISDEKHSYGGWKLWSFINNFIVEDVRVWNEEPRLCLSNTVDFRRVPRLKQRNLKELIF